MFVYVKAILEVREISEKLLQYSHFLVFNFLFLVFVSAGVFVFPWPWPPIPAPCPGPQFVFTGPDPQFVFNGTGPQFLFTGPGQSGAWACIYQPCPPNLYLLALTNDFYYCALILHLPSYL